MCSVEGCRTRRVFAKGLCAKHYMRLRKHGNVDTVLTRGRKPNDIRAQQNKALKEDRQLGKQELLTLRYLERVMPELDPDLGRAVELLANWLFMGGLDDSQGQVVDSVIDGLK